MRYQRLLSALLVIVAATTAFATTPPRKPVIQVAVLLDTSNSMDGLIDQARTQLWRVVNELATAKKDGLAPDLRVALYEYGNDSLPSEKGHIRRVLALTSDLDKVSEELWALKTNGGQEYCGHVIDEATKGLEWSPSNGDLKLIFIAGNEEFTQGNVDYRESCRRAIAKGIIINTIFCGEKTSNIAANWKAGADLADGSFLTIDQNAKVADIPAPQDKEIATLGEQLNKTYIAYGKRGLEGAERQKAQDQTVAAAAPSANVARQVAKAGHNYSNAYWDLVDAKKEGVDLAKIDAKDLPPEMQKMTPAERKAHVEKMEKTRAELQAKIQKLDAERRKYIDAEIKKLPPAKSTLDAAVVTAVRSSGTKKGYRFQ
ncbi:MAG TPA: vWA domain-containing protein [Thermoanaerobaculia bacterium]|nr:vWA domain-containing protein [Thermoanaerobaculia bacterium]